jgi:hypothetical protein
MVFALCPDCGEVQSDGHAPDCELAALLPDDRESFVALQSPTEGEPPEAAQSDGEARE